MKCKEEILFLNKDNFFLVFKFSLDILEDNLMRLDVVSLLIGQLCL